VARIFVTRDLPGPALGRLGDAGHDVDLWPARLPPSRDELLAHASDADALLTMLTERVDPALLDACPRLRAVANYAVGVDNIDVAACAQRGVAVGNTPDVLTAATADLTFALILAAARRLPSAMAAVREGGWKAWEPSAHLGLELDGATLGIVGLGRIGRAVAQRAAGFGLNVIHTGRGDGVPLPTLLARADIITLHCPLTAQTTGLIDARALAAMKPTAILVNTARGPIVDQVALRDALHAGTIAAAALDVTDPEPLPPTDPLLDAPNLIVLPHIGSATTRARERMAELAVANLVAALAGEPMPHPVAVTSSPA
jgi:glyoxylate reductase